MALGGMTASAHATGPRAFLILGALVWCLGCTLSAIRQFDGDVPEGSAVTLYKMQDPPTRFRYEISVASPKFAVGGWSRHGELQLPDDLASRCTTITLLRNDLFGRYCEVGNWDSPIEVRPEPSAGLCEVPPGVGAECAVIFFRSASAPVVAYRGDGSRLDVVSKEAASTKWLKLAVSPVLDIATYPAIAAMVAIGALFLAL